MPIQHPPRQPLNRKQHHTGQARAHGYSSRRRWLGGCELDGREEEDRDGDGRVD